HDERRVSPRDEQRLPRGDRVRRQPGAAMHEHDGRDLVRAVWQRELARQREIVRGPERDRPGQGGRERWRGRRGGGAAGGEGDRNERDAHGSHGPAGSEEERRRAVHTTSATNKTTPATCR